LFVGCGAGAIELVEVQPSGKRRMAAGDWIRGLREPLSAVTQPAARA
jgi:methionyl-tRNA formyltransferase